MGSYRSRFFEVEMADIQLDSAGDLLIQDDSLVIVDGDDALVQHLTIRLRFFLKEWFLDQRVGVPYYEQILIKNPDIAVIRSIFRVAIITTSGISAIDTFDTAFDVAIRKFTVTFTARKDDGETLDFSKEFIIPGFDEEETQL